MHQVPLSSLHRLWPPATKSSSSAQSATIEGLLDTKDDNDLGRLLRDVFDLYAKQITPRETIDIESKGDPALKMRPAPRPSYVHAS